ncbi:MAG TPA: glycosyltransferase [Candidatus Sulfotelmatobacter sp.]|nr:glycosyltransferase [Candidatus Sulfotelmatobacter sp.]
MRIALGILAWNEERTIGQTIASLAQQTLIKCLGQDLESLQIICVPNGCSDGTSHVAAQALEELRCNVGHPSLAWQVRDLAQSGKANAWNHFVHEYADPNADYLILMDADVTLYGEATLELLVRRLERDRHALVATPRFIKNIALHTHKSLSDRLSLAVSALKKGQAGIAGGLYCARAGALRRVWMPLGLLVEDGFLRAMILTQGFRQREEFRRIVCVEDAGLVFEAYRTPRRWFHHERRLVMGMAMNTMLFRMIAALPLEVDPGEWIRTRNTVNPDWVAQTVGENARQCYWVMPRGTIFGKLRRIRQMGIARAALWLPIAVVAFLCDVPVFIAANARLRKPQIQGAWR